MAIPLNYHKSGYGYQVRFVEDLENIDQDMAASLEWAVSEIKKIQGAARSGKPISKPRWPVLILRTPKVRFFPLHSYTFPTCAPSPFSKSSLLPWTTSDLCAIAFTHLY